MFNGLKTKKISKFIGTALLLICGNSFGLEIKPNDPRINIDGINYPVATDDELRLIRFNPTPDIGSKPRRATCAVLFFQTDSPTVSLNFDFDDYGTTVTKIFHVYQDGEVDGDYSMPRAVFTGSIDLNSKNPGNPVTYRVVYPNWSDPILTGITLEDGSQLFTIPDSSKPVCVAFGDSITHGTGQRSSYQGYAYQVAENFGWELYNLGVGGTKITKNFSYAQQLVDFPKVDAITLLYGYNDLVGGSRTVEEYTEAYLAFVDEIRRHQPYADLFCITLTATGFVQNEETGHTPDDFRAVVIKEVQERIARGDHHVYLVHGDELSNTNDVNGGVHFSVEGAARFATNLTAEMTSLLDAPLAPEALPVWATNRLVLADALVGVGYSSAIYPGLDVFDHQDDVLTFTALDPLPRGLTLRSDGKIIGVPTSSDTGTFQFEVKAEDPSGNSSTAMMQMTVRGGVEVAWVAPYDGTSTNTVGLWHMDSSELGASDGELSLVGDAFLSTNAARFETSLNIVSNGSVSVAGPGTDFFSTKSDPDFTVEGWWKINDLTTSHSLVSQGGSTGMSFRYVAIQGGIFKFRGPSGSDKSVTARLLLTEGKWFHVAFTWNATNDEYRVYLNGQQIGSVIDTNYVASMTTTPIKMGTTIGSIDEIRISDIAREYAIPDTVAFWATHAYGIDENEAAPNKDPDMDGYSNEYEYRFGMDPTNGNNHVEGRKPPHVTTYQQGSGHPALTYTYRVDDPTLVYSIEASDDLNQWVADSGNLFSNASPPIIHGDGTETVTKYYLLDYASIPSQAMFFKVKSTQQD